MRGWLLLATLVAALAPATASAAPTTVTSRYGPVELSAYEVARGDQVFNIPKPDISGFITRMEATLVYEDGTPVPIANTMLHHVVMADIGRYVGDKQDPTCDAFRMFDSQSYLPLRGLRFFGVGEERQKLLLPPGYGYPTRAEDKWAMTYMLMNHLPRSETVFIQYTMDIETSEPLQPVTPLWLDVRNCNLDPVYDVPGGAPPGATTSETAVWTAPRAGRIVFSTGHVHGGGRLLRLSKPDCGDQELFVSRPLWGARDHPYYSVRPLLHEPGPISMTTLQTAAGIPFAAGERLQLTSTYDARRPHARVMGILVAAFVPDDTVTDPCAALPGDRSEFWLERTGRERLPRVTVPITALGPSGRARAIKRPPGDRVALGRGATVDVEGFSFAPANVTLPAGRTLRWRFFDSELHNVTFANGPRAFSSDNLDDGRVFSHRFRVRGTYRLFCTLHPVTMSQTVRVR